MNRTPRLILAPLVADGDGRRFAPGAVLLEGDRLVACGTPESIGAVPAAATTTLTDEAVIPALVNAHAHLDLSHLGTVRADAGFARWAATIRAGRAVAESEIAAATDRGIALSLTGGVAAVGDIAGARSTTPVARLRASRLEGVSFVELFGMGRRQQVAIDFMRRLVDSVELDAAGVRLGLQPHAPYSCGPLVYEAAAELAATRGVPVATHLAETLEELRFARIGTGEFAALLREVGAWDDSIEPLGDHPIEALAHPLGRVPWLAAHVNHLDGIDPRRVAALRLRVVYCPRASAFLGHAGTGVAPHAYRQMLAAGVVVAVGTDGLPCLDTPDRLSPLDDLRLLARRDGTDAATLLRMATVNGAIVLGLDPRRFTLAGGPLAGLLAAPLSGDGPACLDAMLRASGPPRWIVEPG